MSCKGRRLRRESCVEPFDWAVGGPETPAEGAAADADPVVPAIDLAALQQDAYDRGYADGERAATDAALEREAAVAVRHATALDDIASLRATVLRQSERQVVRLALAIAARIVHREVSADRDLLSVMIHTALERLGDAPVVTVRLSPEDHERLAALRKTADRGVRSVADPSISRGGCVIESDAGAIDLSVDAQIAEFEALLASDAA